MIIELTEDQAKQLAPMFEDVTRAHALGLTGMLVAQVGQNSIRGAFMTVGFVHNARAKELIRQATEQVPTGDKP